MFELALHVWEWYLILYCMIHKLSYIFHLRLHNNKKPYWRRIVIFMNYDMIRWYMKEKFLGFINVSANTRFYINLIPFDQQLRSST